MESTPWRPDSDSGTLYCWDHVQQLTTIWLIVYITLMFIMLFTVFIGVDDQIINLLVIVISSAVDGPLVA